MDCHRSALLLLTAALVTGCLPADEAPDAATGPPAAPTPSSAASPAAASPAAAPPSTSSATSTAVAAPVDEGVSSPVLDPGADARAATGDAVGGDVALLREVRVGAHRGFDRLVFEFADDDTPSYRVEYVDAPIREDGSGFVVPVDGDAWLSIVMQGASGHTREAPVRRTYDGPRRMRTAQLVNVLELVSTGDFEAVLSWHAGVRTPEPFTVRRLGDPARLVVDVRQP